MNEKHHNSRRDDRRPIVQLQCDDAPGRPVSTWRERLGRPADFPLHAPTDVERAMEAEIAELRAACKQGKTPAAVLTVPLAIMNLPCRPGRAIAMHGALMQSYQEGHRDARHAAADLVLERADDLAALALPSQAGGAA